MDVSSAIQKIKSFYDETKKLELYFFKKYDINIVLEDDAIDFIIETCFSTSITFDDVHKKLGDDFVYGLKLVREKSGRNRFFITRAALIDPEAYISKLIQEELRGQSPVPNL